MTKIPLPVSVLLCILVVSAAAAILFAGGEKTDAPVWQDYRVLCVSPQDREADLLRVLHAAGITGYVTESNAVLSPVQTMTPEMPFFSAAERLRSRWFTDAGGTYRIVYVHEKTAPGHYAGILGPLLTAAGFSWVMENSGSFVLLPVVLLASVLAVLPWLFRPFPLVAAAAVFPFLFSLTRNLPAAWFAGFFWLCGLSVLSAALFPPRRIFSPKDVPPVLVKYARFFLPWFAASVACAFLSGHGIPFVTLVPAGSAALVVLVILLAPGVFSAETLAFTLKNRKRIHPVFRYRMMGDRRPAGKKIPDLRLFFVQAACTLVLTVPVILSFSGAGTGGSRTEMQGKSRFFFEKPEKNPSDALYIPAPERYTLADGFSPDAYVRSTAAGPVFSGGSLAEGFLFSLADFVTLQWNVAAYPWRKLPGVFTVPREGDVILRRIFRRDGSGILVAEEKIVEKFDADFIMRVMEEYTSPLEKMLLRQGKYVHAVRRELPQ